MPQYQPPFTITTKIIHYISEISEAIGTLQASSLTTSPQLRKQNRIKTITGTLAIEGNTLSLEQVTDIIDGKHILGNVKEIEEVKGAIAVYDNLDNFNLSSIDSLLDAHKIMMGTILENAGKFRTSSVGIHKGDKVVHVAPPAKRVRELMVDLINWLKDTDIHPLIASSIFHYELEFIHPFIDGNGRMGRLWQTLILSNWKDVFSFLPLESVIKDRQQEYYDTLEKADSVAESTVFIEFICEAILDVIKPTPQANPQDTPQDEISVKLISFCKVPRSRVEIQEHLGFKDRKHFKKSILMPLIESGKIELTIPDKPSSPKQKYVVVGD